MQKNDFYCVSETVIEKHYDFPITCGIEKNIKYYELHIELPCFQVAELLRHHFSQVDAETIDDALSQIGMRRAGKHFNIRHSGLQFQDTRSLQVVPN